MKKLMIALAVAASAVALNAASIDWQFSEMARDSASPYSLTGYTAYLFTQGTWNEALAEGITADTFNSAVANKALEFTAGGTAPNTTSTWKTNKQTWTDESAESGCFYIVLVDSGKTEYKASTTLTATAYEGKQTHTTASWALTVANTPLKKTDFTAIPEPTSGLLLLLGMAGLALRRKQK